MGLTARRLFTIGMPYRSDVRAQTSCNLPAQHIIFSRINLHTVSMFLSEQPKRSTPMVTALTSRCSFSSISMVLRISLLPAILFPSYPEALHGLDFTDSTKDILM